MREGSYARDHRDGDQDVSGKLVRTTVPGVFKKIGAKKRPYVVVYRAGGKQRKESCRTLGEARQVKRAREADRDRGEFQHRTTLRFREFLSDWIERYAGTGRRGFRESTRVEYRRLLEHYAHRYFGERLRLVDVTPHHLAQFVAWLVDERKQGSRLSDSTIRNIVVPVRAALATAQREGLIRHNPASNLALPVRERVEEDDEGVARALSRHELGMLLSLAPARHRVLFELIASTGLRISEAVGLQRKDLLLDGSSPRVCVRRAIVKRRVHPPKSRHGRRVVALAPSLVSVLRQHVAQLPGDSDALVFPSDRGTPLDPDNLRKRVFKPVAEEVGVPWAGFHSLRHTFASLQLADRVNVLQLSRALGHHAASFTLDVYIHLLGEDQAPALDIEPLSELVNSGPSAREPGEFLWLHSPPGPA